MNENLLIHARAYTARRQLEIAEALGAGKDGLVLAVKGVANPAKVAVKVLRFMEPYTREKLVYQRLEQFGVNIVAGFNVPQLLGSDDQLLALEMTIVERPFVLDFAGAYLDVRPEFPEEVWTQWEDEKREQFEAQWPQVRRVLDAFEARGIYLLDVSPGNIAFAR
jgi:hypothetical protein